MRPEDGSSDVRRRLLLRVTGTVQGVGFRPHVHALATGLGLAGTVRNTGGRVEIDVEGDRAVLAEFRRALLADAPPLASVASVEARPLPGTGARGFAILPSAPDAAHASVPSDTATCGDCLRELWDPADRRHRYPFINCTHCGPRYSIIRAVPYDRATTTMAGFAMCAECAREYHDPSDRRFHAQPTCCPACGPRLVLRGEDGDPIERAAELLAAGRIVAVKGIGGFHLACDAADGDAVRELRRRKRRPGKPLAVLVADLDAARALADVEDPAPLTARSAPVVLLPRRPGAPVADSVAPASATLGLLLPYTPLHHLLARRFGRPYVLTSANASGRPLVYEDESALETLADAVLTHDRPIHAPADDSVMAVFRDAPYPLRRARGLAPRPVRLPVAATRPVLACGGAQKATLCLAAGNTAHLSPHLGDLSDYDVLRRYVRTADYLRSLLQVTPEIVAHDLHPDYPSTRYAQALDGVQALAVQHHHAHIASCLADNGATGPVIGVAFDGTGHGPDGTVWGGEFLVADLTGFRRAGHLEHVPLPGGEAAVRAPWRMTAAYLGSDASHLPVATDRPVVWRAVLELLRSGLNCPPTSSAGRLFDAIAALLGGPAEVTHEGQAAIWLEHLAAPSAAGRHQARLTEDDPFRLHATDLVRAALTDLDAGTPPPVIASRFHHGLAFALADGCELVRQRTGLATVALSGGVFQNLLLLDLTVTELERRGFAVLVHRQVPPNDGGLSLGQAAVAAATGQASADAGERVAYQGVQDARAAEGRP
ncbi:carbamoyltransferase HypF [Actinomadura gamaensis]|uniref:Carbamoyltransferase n=1 Tax=Actinomadura gamaensis TaxID=1763541 RepID=A0ABV9TUJ7_9ACTN